MDRLRVIQWGVGGVGIHALEFVVDSPDLELVGLKCFTDAKVGVDAGALLGREPVGITATQDPDALLALTADVVLYMPRDVFTDPTLPSSGVTWLDEVERILRSGKNVISPLQSPMHWRQLADGEALRDRLEAACQAGGVTAFFTGLDPGFISDCLAMTMTSAAGHLHQVRTLEVIDYDTYGSPETLQGMGFGLLPTPEPATEDDTLVPSWGCAMWLVADALGVELDDIVLATQTELAEVGYVSAGGLEVPAGAVAGMLWSLTGMVGGQPRIVATHVARIGAHVAPGWPTIGEKGGYRVEVDGSPPLRADLPLGLPGGTGTCLGDAVVMTAARCVNAVRSVVEAPTGYLLLNDLKVFGGRMSAG